MLCSPIKSSFLEKFGNNRSSGDKTENSESVKKEKSRRQTRRHLPVPKGPHTVGIVDVMCDRGGHEIFFRLYYPTASTDIYARDRQWPLWLPRKQYAWGYLHFLRKDNKLFRKLFNWLGGDVHVPALWQSVPLQSDQPYPVIIFSHGLGGNRTTYTTMCVELASQGFVVACLEHRDGSASTTLCLKNNHRSSVRVCADHNDNTSSAENHNITSNSHPHRNHSHHHDSHHNNNNNNNSSSNHHHHHKHHHQKSHNDHHYHHHYLKEEWQYFKHFVPWDNFEYRNGQMHERAGDCREALSLLEEINAGSAVLNSMALSFNTQRFKGLLDMSRVSVIGHSFGGATCIAALGTDPRFKVGIVLDGWMHPIEESLPGKVKQPTLMVNMESFQWKRNIEQMRKMQEDTQADRPMITIRGTCHQSVTDFQFLCNLAVGRVMEVRFKLDPHRCMDMSCKATLGFLRKHLGMNDKSHYDDILSGEHELIIPGTNVSMS